MDFFHHQQRQPEKQPKFPNEKTQYLPFEIEDDSFPIDRNNPESPPPGPDELNFEQSLAKSFDDMFNDDLLDTDFGEDPGSLKLASVLAGVLKAIILSNKKK